MELRKSKKLKLGRAFKMSQWEWLLLFLCSVAICWIVGFYFFRFQIFYEGLKSFHNKDYITAEKKFLQVLSRDIKNFSARLNLGLTKFFQKNFEESLKEYRKVEEDSPYSLERFYAFFNSGHLKSYEGDIDQALDFYQQALNENSDSIEVKTNIELMFQKRRSEKSSQKESKDEENFPQESKGQQSKGELQSKSSSEGKGQENLSNFEKGESQLDSKGGSAHELSLEQIQFILKEIENKEKELKTRLNKQPEEKRQRKKW